jgi:hypothetical protein
MKNRLALRFLEIVVISISFRRKCFSVITILNVRKFESYALSKTRQVSFKYYMHMVRVREIMSHI